jgi:hypothetical protein
MNHCLTHLETDTSGNKLVHNAIMKTESSYQSFLLKLTRIKVKQILYLIVADSTHAVQ